MYELYSDPFAVGLGTNQELSRTSARIGDMEE